MPPPNLPPSALSWVLGWLVLLATPVAALWAARRWRDDPDRRDDVDPALVGVALLSLALPLGAVRFLWLAILPLLLVARALRGVAGRRAFALSLAIAAVLLVPAFLRAGAWPRVTRALPTTAAGYAQPYSAAKYFGHAVWLMKDADLRGNVFNDYFLGGYLGYWLAPDARAFANGTLNLSPDAMDANLPLRERRGVQPGESFTEALDRLDVDLFFGIRLPEVGPPNRPWFYTTAHLEHVEGWVPLFRNLRSALYLRRNERNGANLARVVAYYEREDVPFDADRGFDPEAVIREAPDWAVAHGVVPFGFDALALATRDIDPARRGLALDRLASIHAALGLYERSIRTDRRRLRAERDAVPARRRLVWSLLRRGDRDAAAAEADALLALPEVDPLSRAVAETALDGDATAGAVRRLAVFDRVEASRVVGGYVPPLPRPRR